MTEPVTLTPSDIEARAKALGKSIAQVCREAQIAPSTFSRWKAEKTEPTLDIYRRIIAATAPADTQAAA